MVVAVVVCERIACTRVLSLVVVDGGFQGTCMNVTLSRRTAFSAWSPRSYF